MTMNWTKIALNLPTIIGVAIETVERIKGPKKGPEKEAAVLQAALDDLSLSVTAEDVLADPALAELLKNYIRARVALANFLSARAAVGGAL